MDHRSVGRSGLTASVISLRVGRDDEASAAGVRAAREAGVDTFLVGPEEGAEEAFAQLLGAERGELVLAAAPRFAGPPRLSRAALPGACEEALRRLGTECLDLLVLPGFDELTPLEETLRTVDDLTAQGKVRYVGVSRFAAWQLMKALGVAAERGWNRPTTAAVRYSLAARDAEFDHFPLAREEGVGQFARAGLDVGAADAVAAEIGAERGVPPAQAALAWVLAEPAISSCVLVAEDPAIGDALGAGTLVLEPGEKARLDAVAAARQPYPQWHQINWANDRPVGPDRAAPPAPQPDAEAV